MEGDENKDLEPEVKYNVQMVNRQIVTPLGWATMVCDWSPDGTRDKDMKGRFIVLPSLEKDIFFSKVTRKQYGIHKHAKKRSLTGKMWMLQFTKKTPEQIQEAKEKADAIKAKNEEQAKKDEQERAKARQESSQSQQSSGEPKKK